MHISGSEVPGWRIPVAEVLLQRPASVLVDLDGTLTLDGRLVPGAVELLTVFGGRAALITNNSADSPEEIGLRLGRLGLRVEPSTIFTAGSLLVRSVAALRPARVFPVLSPSMLVLARKLGANLTDGDDAEVVAVGRCAAFDYRMLGVAANALRRGARLLVANPDTSHPAGDDRICPETGALVAAIVAASGVLPRTEVLGKPAPELALQALRHLGIEASERVVVVGDSPATDGALAQAIGARFVHVGAAAPAALEAV